MWFHAGRAFSETPSAALAVIAFALWLRGGREGFVPGVIAMTCAALVRPPLAPVFVLAVVLAAWWVRRDARLVAAGAAAGVAVLAVIMIPAVLAAGGWGVLLDVSEIHAGEIIATLGTESWALESIGFVRGLGTPAFAALFLALAAVGWWGWRRSLAGRWWAGTLAGATLMFLLEFMDNRNYPRYWVLVWLLLATPAVAGAARLGRSRAAGLAAAGVGLVAAIGWGFPAVWHIHRHRLPVVAALAAAAGEGPGVLIYEDQLFSFRNLAAISGRLPVDSLRVTEMERAGPRIAGAPLWLLAEQPGEDLPCPASRVFEFDCRQARVRRLSQERFLHVRLVKNPVLVARGGKPVEFDGTGRFVWCGAHAALLAPRVSGPGTLALAVEVHPSLHDVPAEVRVAGVRTWSEPGLRRSAGHPDPCPAGRELPEPALGRARPRRAGRCRGGIPGRWRFASSTCRCKPRRTSCRRSPSSPSAIRCSAPAPRPRGPTPWSDSATRRGPPRGPAPTPRSRFRPARGSSGSSCSRRACSRPWSWSGWAAVRRP